MTIIETQKKIAKGADPKIRVYHIEGPKDETIVSFWQWLTDQGIMDSFEAKA